MKNLIILLLWYLNFAHGSSAASNLSYVIPDLNNARATASGNRTSSLARLSSIGAAATFSTALDDQTTNRTFSGHKAWPTLRAHPEWLSIAAHNPMMNLFVDGPYGTDYFALTEKNLEESDAIPWYARWTADVRDDPTWQRLGEVSYWGSIFLQDDDYHCGIIYHGCTHRPYWQDLSKMYPHDQNLARKIYFVMKIHTAINLATDVLYVSLANSIGTTSLLIEDLVVVATEQQSLNARFQCDMRIKFAKSVKKVTWDLAWDIAKVWMTKGVLKITWDPTGGKVWEKSGGKAWWEKSGKAWWEYIRTGDAKKKPKKSSSASLPTPTPSPDRPPVLGRPGWPGRPRPPIPGTPIPDLPAPPVPERPPMPDRPPPPVPERPPMPDRPPPPVPERPPMPERPAPEPPSATQQARVPRRGFTVEDSFKNGKIVARDSRGDYYDESRDDGSEEREAIMPTLQNPSTPFFKGMMADGLFIYNSYYDPTDYLVSEPFLCGRGLLQPADNAKVGRELKHWLADQSSFYKKKLSNTAHQLNMGTFYSDEDGPSVLSHMMASSVWVDNSEFLRRLENPYLIEESITMKMKESILSHIWVSAGCFMVCSADSSAIGGNGDGLSRFRPRPGRICQAQCVSRDHKRTIIPLPGLQKLVGPTWNYDIKSLLRGAYENFKEYGNNAQNSWFELVSHFDSDVKEVAFTLPVCDSDGYAQIPDLTDSNVKRGGTNTFPASCGNSRADGLRDFLASTSLITPDYSMPRDGPMPFNDPTGDYLWQHTFPYSVDRAIQWPLDQFMSYCEAGIHWPKICPRDPDAKLFMSSMHRGPSKWCAEIKERYKDTGDFVANIDFCTKPSEPMLYEYKTLDSDFLNLKGTHEHCFRFLRHQARKNRARYGRYLAEFTAWHTTSVMQHMFEGVCLRGDSSDPDW